MSKRVLKLLAAAIGSLSLFAASAANATTVTADVITNATGTPSVWTINAGSVSEVTGYPLPPDGPWTTIAGAQWITVEDGPYADPGDYTFTTKISLPVPVGETITGSINLEGVFSSDNYLESVSINGATANVTSISFTGPGSHTYNGTSLEGAAYASWESGRGPAEYLYKIDLASASTFDLSNPVTLSFVVHNEKKGDGFTFGEPLDGVSEGPNPVGFLFKGTLSTEAFGPSVPVPASLWSGLTLFGLLGAAKLRSTRKQGL